MARSKAAAGGGALVIVLLLGAASAAGACRMPLSQASLSNFADHPQRYLDRYPSGGKDLAYAIRNFASFNRSGLKGVAAAIRIASPVQKKAIGWGLAEAVNACLPRDGDVARQIADVVKTIADRDITDAYLGAADGQGSPPPAAAASSASETPARRAVSLSLDQSTTIEGPVVPAIAPPLKNR